MTDLNDKFQKLLENVEALNFNEGVYLQLCDALKSVKDKSCEYIVNDINISLEFDIDNKHFFIVLNSSERLSPGNSRYHEIINYSIKSELRVLDYKKPASEFIKIVKNYLKYAKNIKIFHQQDISEHSFSIKWDSFAEICLYYNLQSFKECITCGNGQNDCDHCYDNEYVIRLIFSID